MRRTNGRAVNSPRRTQGILGPILRECVFRGRRHQTNIVEKSTEEKYVLLPAARKQNGMQVGPKRGPVFGRWRSWRWRWCGAPPKIEVILQNKT